MEDQSSKRENNEITKQNLADTADNPDIDSADTQVSDANSPGSADIHSHATNCVDTHGHATDSANTHGHATASTDTHSHATDSADTHGHATDSAETQACNGDSSDTDSDEEMFGSRNTCRKGNNAALLLDNESDLEEKANNEIVLDDNEDDNEEKEDNNETHIFKSRIVYSSDSDLQEDNDDIIIQPIDDEKESLPSKVRSLLFIYNLFTASI